MSDLKAERVTAMERSVFLLISWIPCYTRGTLEPIFEPLHPGAMSNGRFLPPLSRWLLAVLLLAWGSCGSSVIAQSSPDGKMVPLGQALERLATHAEVSLVYDAALVEGHYTACSVEAQPSPEPALNCLLGRTGLDFVQTSGGTYVVKADVRRPPQHGSVTGVVQSTDRGAHLPNAHVRVQSASVGTATDTDGRFRLSDLVAGPHTLVVSHLGYETKTVEIRVPPGGTARHTIALAPSSIALDSVLVDAPEVHALPPSRRHAVLSPEQLQQTSPAGTPSVAHAAGRLLGVTTEAPYADLHVQGSASSAHQVRLDGVPVRNPAATGRLLGAFSPMALDGLVAHKAGFGALRGDALSGILQLEHDLQRPDTRYATVRVDPVSLSGRAEGTVELGTSTATAMGAARVGTWGVHKSYALSRLIDTWSVLDPVLTAAQLSADSLVTGGLTNRQARPQNQFYDLHGAAKTTFGNGRRLYVSAYHGRSVLGSDLVSPLHASALSSGTPEAEDYSGRDNGVEVPTSDRYSWTNTMTQATLESPLSARATGRLKASLSRYRAESRFDLEWIPPQSVTERSSVLTSVQGSNTSNAVTELGLEGTLHVRLSERDRLTLQSGITSLASRFSLANAFVGRVGTTAQSTRLTTAGRAEVGLGRFTTLAGGLRLTALPDRGALFAEPRATLRYHRPQTALGEVAARVGGGLYRQYTTQFEVSRDGATAVVPTAQVWMPVPTGLQPPKAYHLTSSVTWGPHPAWSVGLEGYGKWTPHLLAVDYPALQTEAPAGVAPPSDILSASRGHTYGGGLRVSYEGAWGRSTLRYAYSRSRRTFPGRFEGRVVSTPWNEPHRVTLDARLPLNDVLSVDLRGTGIWGRRWGYQRAYYAYLWRDDIPHSGSTPDLDHPEQHRLPPLYRLDASLVASHTWGDVTITGRLGLVNALGRTNVADWGLRPSGDGNVTRRARTLPGRRSILSLQVRY